MLFSRPVAIQYSDPAGTAWTSAAIGRHALWVRKLPHIRKLDDAFGHFLVQVTCKQCNTGREIAPEALARIVGWSTTLEALALRMRCSKCGTRGAEVVAMALPRLRGVPKNPQ